MNTTTPSEIVFIDSSIPDYQLILGSIPAAWPVVVLNNQEDGLVQITHALSQYTQLTAVHIISHAETARLNLGSARIDSHNLNQYSDSLQSWKQSLAVNADILFYGCDLAQGDLGQNFINQFSRLTGFDVAASSNPTSAASDFVLEKNAGAIETPTLNLSLGGWQGELGTVLNASNAVFNFSNKTNIVGTGVNNNDVVRFNSVATIDGQSLDAVVKTTLNKATISSYDSTSSPTSVSRYFQPTIVSTSANGYAQFDVSFYLAGTYNGAGTGTQLTLQNLTVNSYDIDTVTGVHQYQVFGGFAAYSLASASGSTPSVLQTSVLADGSVKFLATGSGNGSIDTTTADDAYRVSVKYDSVQSLMLRGGSDANNASSGFALDFGPGVNWAGAATARNTPAKNLVYSQSALTESVRNDGRITGSVVVNLVNDTFTGINGEDLVSSGKAVVTGLPAGISASVLRNSATSALLSFTGQATNHKAIDSSTVFIRFADSALTSGQAATVTGNGDHAIALNFQNQPVLQYSNNTFYEAAGNNGAIANSLVISL
ncbi:MAG: DUF4347 domain-containing protein, partial [Methylococcaceae bacterium]|nr:DUF4347 domain-containing protein [Methylococcaceae bacterium]